MSTAPSHTVPAFTQSLRQSSFAVTAAAVTLGAAFIAAMAQVEVPMYPVPMTMQTFAVLLVGSLYGARLGAITLGVYLLAGLVGLPVFAGAGNIVTLIAKPATAGYLVGFLAAAAVVGAMAERGFTRTLAGTAAAYAAGSAAIYLCGLPWLALMIGWEKAIAFGLVPFLLGDGLKAALAASVRAAIGGRRLGTG